MEEWFDIRTMNHIELVRKYCWRICKRYKYSAKLIDRSWKHDSSKFKEPEKIPYIYLTWLLKCRMEGVDYKIPDNIDTKKATLYHILNNSHHPEYHQKETEGILAEDRDGIPEKIIDATNMTVVDIAEMIADWCAMSEEKGTNTPKEWAEKVINKRWRFTDEQVDMIYYLIEKIWD